MNHYRSFNITESKIRRVFPFLILYSFILLMYSCIVLSCLASAYKICLDNKSIVYEYQSNLPRISFDSTFDGNLSELMPSGANMCQVYESSYKVDSKETGGYVVVGSKEYPASIVFADIDGVFTITNGEEFWIARRPSPFEVYTVYSNKFMTYLPELFCMFFELPLGLFVIPVCYSRYKKVAKTNKLADIMVSIFSCTVTMVGLFIDLVCVFCF